MNFSKLCGYPNSRGVPFSHSELARHARCNGFAAWQSCGVPTPSKTSNVQRIAILARQAYDAAKPGIPFDEWRQRECMLNFNNRLSTASRGTLDRMEEYFAALAGVERPAAANLERRQRYVIAKLARECGISGPDDYAASLDARRLKGVIINLSKKAKDLKAAAQLQAAA